MRKVLADWHRDRVSRSGLPSLYTYAEMLEGTGISAATEMKRRDRELRTEHDWDMLCYRDTERSLELFGRTLTKDEHLIVAVGSTP